MAVRVRLRLAPRIPASAPALEVVGLIQLGLRSRAGGDHPAAAAGREIRLVAFAPRGHRKTYGAVSGTFQVYRLPGALDVEALAPHRSGPGVLADAAIVPGGREVLISDALAGPLGLVLVDVAQGLWTFRDELTATMTSEARQLW